MKYKKLELCRYSNQIDYFFIEDHSSIWRFKQFTCLFDTNYNRKVIYRKTYETVLVFKLWIT